MAAVGGPRVCPAYPEEYLKMWQFLWGDHFLSPGGPEEVRRLTEGRGVGGMKVLDVGCGLGGSAAFLVQEMNVYSLVGIDFQEKLVSMASKWAAEIGLGDIAEFRHVDSLAWPFPDDAFDVVFVKDLLFHTDDALYDEIFRVLKPGGRLILADWFGTDRARTRTFSTWLERNAFAKVSMTLGGIVDACILSGFSQVEVEDRSDRFVETFREDAEKLRGETGKQFEGEVGAEVVRQLLSSWVEPCAALSKQGQLRAGTIYATKPSV
uniref:phosphoethanolamine N-methyltransferase n=1 Tax=Alexandrium monilatum TaxID=311494 RepID=A0A7S4R1M0_9DINO|mmetsp:Transcript_21683/g.65184  ORF Transcript_21683/g.65184 Transcript_21683/m.65184 type:complete len:265 (+) Transcript_21683:54-848(+)